MQPQSCDTQGCMFRQSVRRAMKGITTKLEGEHKNLLAAQHAQLIATQIGSVTQHVAEVIQRVHLVSCLPSCIGIAS